jgi:hypothetical protein
LKEYPFFRVSGVETWFIYDNKKLFVSDEITKKKSQGIFGNDKFLIHPCIIIDGLLINYLISQLDNREFPCKKSDG